MIIHNITEDMAGEFRAQLDLGDESIYLKFNSEPSVDDIVSAYDKYLDAQVQIADAEIEEESLESSIEQYIEHQDAIDEILTDYLSDQSALGDLDEYAAEEIAEGRLLSGAAAQHRSTK